MIYARFRLGRTSAAALMVLLATTPLPAQDTTLSLAPPSDPALINRLGAVDIETLTGFRERPLFTPSRRAPAAPEPVAADPEPQPEPEPEPEVVSTEAPSLRLAGIVDSDGERAALVFDQSSGEKMTLHVGDAVGDWTVGDIGDTSVTLSSGDQTADFQMFAPADGGQGADTGDSDAGAGDGSDSGASADDTASDGATADTDPVVEPMPDPTDMVPIQPLHAEPPGMGPSERQRRMAARVGIHRGDDERPPRSRP